MARRPRTDLTQQEIKSLVDYNPETGEFVWRPRSEKDNYHGWNGVYAGKPAGTTDRAGWNGYKLLTLRAKQYKYHRLVWLWMTGSFPPDGVNIDHINGDKADNRWCNLRLATVSQNGANAKLSKANKSGAKGVFFRSDLKKKWGANLKVGNVILQRWCFETFEEALAQRREWEREYFGEYARPLEATQRIVERD